MKILDLHQYGFRIEGTGGGCTAWRKDFADGGYVLASSGADPMDHVLDSETVALGFYNKDDEVQLFSLVKTSEWAS